jgi:hypothetical protein
VNQKNQNKRNEERNKMDRTHVENILPIRLESYMQEFEEDMKLNENNIHEKTFLRSGIAAKWARYSYEEERYKKQILDKIEELKETITQKLFEKKKEDIINQRTSEMKIKIEVEQILKKSTQYAKIKDELSNQDDIIRFIIEAKQIISSFGFDIKNSIEVLKIENI